MEALSCLIAKAVEGGFLSGCSFGGREGDELTVSHLLYADDTILFCEPKQDQMAYLNWLLMWFDSILGLKINLAKSEIIPEGSVVNMEALANEIGCKFFLFRSSFGGTTQFGGNLGCYRRKVSKKAGFVEETVYLKRGETHSPS